ncbi:MAG: MBL fold metallo-hydrolase [Anaerolineales bacterium]
MPPFEIHTLDLRFQNAPEAIAAFLVIGPGGPVLVETGPGSTLATLQRELSRHGVAPADMRDVLVTHIHLDHAGAAGWWAQQGARVQVHHLGAPHLIEPGKLLASAQRIYGDKMHSLWGDTLASPAERVHALHDGDVIEAGGLKFRALDTPGHARHHLVYQLGDIAFTGDLAGIRLSGRGYVRLPTPPPEFDLDAWLGSLARARAQRFSRLYLTHFGPVEDAQAQWDTVEALLPQYAALVQQALEHGAERDAVVARLTEWEEARQQAARLDADARALYSGVGPTGMSADGLMRYWRKRAGGNAARF